MAYPNGLAMRIIALSSRATVASVIRPKAGKVPASRQASRTILPPSIFIGVDARLHGACQHTKDLLEFLLRGCPWASDLLGTGFAELSLFNDHQGSLEGPEGEPSRRSREGGKFLGNMGTPGNLGRPVTCLARDSPHSEVPAAYSAKVYIT